MYITLTSEPFIIGVKYSAEERRNAASHCGRVCRDAARGNAHEAQASDGSIVEAIETGSALFLEPRLQHDPRLAALGVPAPYFISIRLLCVRMTQSALNFSKVRALIRRVCSVAPATALLGHLCASV